jgi:4-hydroxy-tetrahydrodipicolinate reductase
MTVEAFQDKIAQGRMGHVGLPQSMGMLFQTLGKELVRYEDHVEPVVADTPIKTSFFDVKPGQVRGVKQIAHGFSPEGEFVTLTFVAALDWPEDEDTIRITGTPGLEVNLHGTNGDIATVAIAVNAIRRVVQAAPGLVTMRDLPIVTR